MFVALHVLFWSREHVEDQEGSGGEACQELGWASPEEDMRVAKWA